MHESIVLSKPLDFFFGHDIMPPMIDKRIERLEEMQSELFDLANSFAGEQTGTVAAELHESCNRISNSIRMLKEGITPADERKMLGEWFAKQPGLLELMSRR